MSLTTLTYSKIDYCPTCNRKLCKRHNADGCMAIEFRHKGAEIQASEMTIKCIGCSHKYIVSAEHGINDEVS